jgi:trans-2,3-dihydro-3-hydroxyanthranilate isomerase
MATNQRSLRYRVVDVFTRQALEGNALAVFPDGSGLDSVTMQRIAKELNLSETVFVLPASQADCAACLRIFTPNKELIFAGHPTIGTSFVLLDERMVPEGTEHFILEEGVGPVAIRVESSDRPLIWLTTPAITTGNTYDPEVCAAALGLSRSDLLDVTPQVLSAGNPTLFVALQDEETVDRAWLDTSGYKALQRLHDESMCVFVFAPVPDGAYSRMFAPEYGIAEDPATGSSTGPLAAFMMQHKLVPETSGTRFISEQGTKMGRRSILHVHIFGERGVDGIAVGGYVTPLSDALMTL